MQQRPNLSANRGRMQRPRETAPGPLPKSVAHPLRRGDVLEIHEGSAVPNQRERPAIASRASVAAARERLLPAALHHLTHRVCAIRQPGERVVPRPVDRKSTRLNSSHSQISYAVFCLKKKTDFLFFFVAQISTICTDRNPAPVLG